MLDIGDLPLEGLPAVRVSAATGGPVPGIVLCADPGADLPAPHDDLDSGWPGLADHLAATVPAIVALCGAGPGYSPSGLIRHALAAARALRFHERGSGHVGHVGYGLGGAAAIVAAARDIWVEGAVALGTGADPTLIRLGDDAHLAGLRAAGLADPPDHADWRRDFLREAPSRHAHRLAGRPVLLLWGAADRVVPRAQVEALARLSGGVLDVLPTAGHHLRRHPAAIERVVAFMRGVMNR